MKIAMLFVAAALLAGCDTQNAGGGDGVGRQAPYAQDQAAYDAEGVLGTAANPFEVDGEWPFATLAHRNQIGTFAGVQGAFVDAVELDGATWYGWMSAEEIGPERYSSGSYDW